MIEPGLGPRFKAWTENANPVDNTMVDDNRPSVTMAAAKTHLGIEECRPLPLTPHVSTALVG